MVDFIRSTKLRSKKIAENVVMSVSVSGTLATIGIRLSAKMSKSRRSMTCSVPRHNTEYATRRTQKARESLAKYLVDLHLVKP